jgi:hypothetical protein
MREGKGIRSTREISKGNNLGEKGQVIDTWVPSVSVTHTTKYRYSNIGMLLEKATLKYLNLSLSCT